MRGSGPGGFCSSRIRGRGLRGGGGGEGGGGRAENTHEEERSRRFLIEPHKIKEFEERAEAQRMGVLGFYHSHPDHPAEPSEYDRNHAWPGYSYVIASVGPGAAQDARSWPLSDDPPV